MAVPTGAPGVYCLEFAGEDDAFAAAEARAAAAGVEVLAPGLALARSVDPDRLRRLAFTRRASEVLGRTDADVASARALVEAASVDRTGTVAVRARDVRGTAGVDTSRVERALGEALVDRGFAVDLDDPDHELRALFSDRAEPRSAKPASGQRPQAGVCVVGWLAAESVRDFGDRQPTDRPFFQPGSMDPLLARALANLAGARPGATLLDPMCGTGGVLLEGGLVGADPVGVDAQAEMARGARRNLRASLDRPGELVRGDATRLPLRESSVDAVAFDAPYGRQSKIEGRSLDDLVGGALREARRVLDDATPGRAVVVGDRPWIEAAEAAGWTVAGTFERRVHRSLVRHIVILE